jgi:hypothetical protein
MTVADDLRILVDDVYPEMVDNLNLMLTKLNEQRTLTVEEIVTVNDGVMDAAETQHLARLEALRVANGWAGFYTYGQYGIENLTEWVMYAWNGSPTGAVTYLTADSFRYNSISGGGGTFSFVLAQPGNITRQILSGTFGPPQPPPPPPPVYTYITYSLFPGTPLPAGLSTIDFSAPVAVVDAELADHQENFETAWHHINDPIDIDGTYGLIARRDQIDLGIDVQTKNRDAYLKFIEDYEPYAA